MRQFLVQWSAKLGGARAEGCISMKTDSKGFGYKEFKRAQRVAGLGLISQDQFIPFNRIQIIGWQEFDYVEGSDGPVCEDCGEQYFDFGLDTTLSNEEWRLIHPEGEEGLLCANCIVKRAAKVDGVVACRMVLDFGKGL